MRSRIQRPFGGRRSRVAAARLPLDEYAQLAARALIAKMTPGRLMRELVERYLSEREGLPIGR